MAQKKKLEIPLPFPAYTSPPFARTVKNAATEASTGTCEVLNHAPASYLRVGRGTERTSERSRLSYIRYARATPVAVSNDDDLRV